MFIEDNVPVDGEGDLCFEVSVIDRRNYNSLNYIPIKYSYWQNEKKITAKEKFQEAYDNLKHARFNQLLANDSVNSKIGELDRAVERMKKEGLL